MKGVRCALKVEPGTEVPAKPENQGLAAVRCELTAGGRFGGPIDPQARTGPRPPLRRAKRARFATGSFGEA